MHNSLEDSYEKNDMQWYAKSHGIAVCKLIVCGALVPWYHENT